MITARIEWEKDTIRHRDETKEVISEETITVCNPNCAFYGSNEVDHWCSLKLSEPYNKEKPGETKKEAFLRSTFLNPQVPGPRCPGPGEYSLEKVVRSPEDRVIFLTPGSQ